MATPLPLYAVLTLATGAFACQRSRTPFTPSHAPTPTAPSLALSPAAIAQTPIALPPTPAPVYRVGGDVLEPIEIERVQAHYPEACRAHPVQSMPIFEAVIDARGTVASVRAVHPPHAKPPCPDFEAACRKALSQWRYRPATLHGKPVAVHLSVTFGIHLQ